MDGGSSNVSNRRHDGRMDVHVAVRRKGSAGKTGGREVRMEEREE